MASFDSLSGKIDSILKNSQLNSLNIPKTGPLGPLGQSHPPPITNDKAFPLTPQKSLCVESEQEDEYMFSIDIQGMDGKLYTLGFKEGEKINDVVSGFFKKQKIDEAMKEPVMELISKHLKEHVFKGDHTPGPNEPIRRPLGYSPYSSPEKETNGMRNFRMLEQETQNYESSESEQGIPVPAVKPLPPPPPPPPPPRSPKGYELPASDQSENEQAEGQNWDAGQPEDEIESDEDEEAHAAMYQSLKNGWNSQAQKQQKMIANLPTSSEICATAQVKQEKKNKTGKTAKKSKSKMPTMKETKGARTRRKKKVAPPAHERLFAYAAVQQERMEQKMLQVQLQREKEIQAAMKPLPRTSSNSVLQRVSTKDKEPAHTRLYEEGMQKIQQQRRSDTETKQEEITEWYCPNCSRANSMQHSTCQNPVGVKQGQEVSKLLPMAWTLVDLEKFAQSKHGSHMLIKCGQPQPELFKPTRRTQDSAGAANYRKVTTHSSKDIFTHLYEDGLQQLKDTERKIKKIKEEEYNFEPSINERSKALVEARRQTKIKLKEKELAKSQHPHTVENIDISELKITESRVEELWENTMRRLHQPPSRFF